MKASGALHSKALVLAGKASKRGCLFCVHTSQINHTAKNIFTFFNKIFATIKFYSTFVRSNRHNNTKNNHLTTTQWQPNSTFKTS